MSNFIYNRIFLLTCRCNSKCNGEGERESDKNKKEKTQMAQTKNSIENTGESLRRSLRKQNSNVTVEPLTSPVGTVQSVLSNDDDVHARRSSRSKHHKNKAKHHKDKRKKKRHLKTMDVVLLTEYSNRSSSDITAGDERQVSMKRNNSKLVDGIDTQPNLKDSVCVATKEIVYVTTKTECIDSIEVIENVNINKSEANCSVKNVDTKALVTVSDKSKKAVLNRLSPSPSTKSDVSETSIEQVTDAAGATSDVVSCVKPLEAKEDKNVSDFQYADHCEGTSEAVNCSSTDTNMVQEVEDRKLKKKRKRLKYDTQRADDENVIGDSSEDLLDDSMHKHRKKRHKHTSEHRNRKHHDVRKAPQDGIVRDDDNTCSVVDDVSETTSSKPQNETNAESLMSEPQRLAIKIKLCQECNNRHLQDACPLTAPQYAIPDSITYEDWLKKHKENAEVFKAIKSDDPMSEGYGKIVDDNVESDDDSSLTEQHKTKTKTQKEEKRLIIDSDRPLYARESLPECLELRITNSEHGLGIYAKNSVPMHVKLGPLVGRPVKEMDIPDDFSMRHIWEVRTIFYVYHIKYFNSKFYHNKMLLLWFPFLGR